MVWARCRSVQDVSPMKHFIGVGYLGCLLCTIGADLESSSGRHHHAVSRRHPPTWRVQSVRGVSAGGDEARRGRGGHDVHGQGPAGVLVTPSQVPKT